MSTTELERKIQHELRLHRQRQTTATSGVINARFIYLGQEEWRAFVPLIVGISCAAAQLHSTRHTYEGAEVLFIPSKPNHLNVT